MKKEAVADILGQVLDLYEKKLAAFNVATCKKAGIDADSVFSALRQYCASCRGATTPHASKPSPLPPPRQPQTQTCSL